MKRNAVYHFHEVFEKIPEEISLLVRKHEDIKILFVEQKYRSLENETSGTMVWLDKSTFVCSL